MAKDHLGSWLEGFIRLGAHVDIRRPDSPEHESALMDKGYGFYPMVPRDALMDGRFADMIGGYDANLVHYAVSDPTIRRRVSTGLSTRFANAVCAPTPVVVPPEADFARRQLDHWGTGIAERDPCRCARRGGRGRRSHELQLGIRS